MRRLIYVFSTLLALTVFLGIENANAGEGQVTVGAQAGEVGLGGDVGNTYGSALGVGAFFSYAASDFLEFELGWLSSKHSGNGLNLAQNAYNLDIIYDVDQFDIFVPYIKGGAEFVTHQQDIVNVSPAGITSTNLTGFGLNVGLGARVDLGKNFMTALDFDFHNIFNTTVTPIGGSGSINAIQSYFTVLLRFGFAFGGGGGSWLNRK